MDIDSSDIGIIGIAHRGYSKDAPENTLPAYKLAKEKNFEYVECDVRFTKDNIPILIHDETINRTSTGKGKVSDLNFVELNIYDYGSWKGKEFVGTKLMKLEDFLKFCSKENLNIYLEIKDDDISHKQAKILIDLVQKYNMLNNITWISFYSNNLRLIMDIQINCRIGLIGDISEELISEAESLKTLNNQVFINVSHRRLSKKLIEDSIAKGIPVEVWTIDTMLKLKRMIKLGITGITTNSLEIDNIIKEYLNR